MPIIGSFGAGSAGGYGQRKGGLQPYDIDFLLVAGGGAGGGTGGGGGAGGFRKFTSQTVNPGETVTITVGTGGNAPGSLTRGDSGGNSIINSTTLGTISSKILYII